MGTGEEMIQAWAYIDRREQEEHEKDEEVTLVYRCGRDQEVRKAPMTGRAVNAQCSQALDNVGEGPKRR